MENALLKHIADCEHKASMLAGLIDAACNLDNDGHKNGLVAVLESGLEMARDLADSLDTTALPKPEDAASEPAATVVTPDYVETAIQQALDLNSMLGVLAQAADGAQITGKTFEQAGGGAVADFAARMSLDLIEGLELGAQSKGAGA